MEKKVTENLILQSVLSPNEIKTILKRNFYWASTIKTPFLTGAQVEMLIRELKKKHV